MVISDKGPVGLHDSYSITFVLPPYLMIATAKATEGMCDVAAGGPEPAAGGREPIWSQDGTELFYRRGDQMISVPLAGGEEFEPGTEEVLFTGNFSVEVGGRNQFYGVTPDGQQFIMIAPQTEGTRVNVVLNWFEELRELVPVGR